MSEEIIYIFQNSFWGKSVKTSGGDIRFVNIFRRIQERFSSESVIFVNREGFHFDTNYGLNYKFLITPLFFDRFGVFLSYCLRTVFIVLQLLFLPKGTFFYSVSDFFPDTIPPFLLKCKNNIWIQVIHHIYPHYRKRQGNKIVNFVAFYLQRISFLLIKARGDKIIVVNKTVAEELSKLGFNREKICISSNAVDIDYFRKINRINFKYEGVFLGRLKPSKGVLDLIPIWNSVCKVYPNAKLAIIGEGSNEIKIDLLKKIKQHDLENNVILLGYLEDKEAIKALKSGKMFLFPSHEEGWGIAVAEAMASELPVVSWDFPVYQDVFETYTIRVEENNIELFAEKVIELLSDDEKRVKYGSEGYKFIHKYSWDMVTEKETRFLFL